MAKSKYTDAEINEIIEAADKKKKEDYEELKEHRHSCNEEDTIGSLDITEIKTDALEKNKANKTSTEKSGKLKIVVERADSENAISIPAVGDNEKTKFVAGNANDVSKG